MSCQSAPAYRSANPGCSHMFLNTYGTKWKYYYMISGRK
ncbi:unnamed protein product, partial [Staurois parvus]